MLSILLVQILCPIGQALVTLVLVVFFIAGLGILVGSLARIGSSSRRTYKRSRVDIEHIAEEGKHEMSNLSEQYLNSVYDQVTTQPPTRR